MSRHLILLLFIFLSLLSPILSTCSNGPKCTKNSECPQDSRCFFGEKDSLGTGKCCELPDDTPTYMNYALSELFDDPNARIPGALLYPQRDEFCESSKDCRYSESCMVSKSTKEDLLIPPILPYEEKNKIKMHCYKRGPSWSLHRFTNALEYCNTHSDCSNNFCVKLGVVIEAKPVTVWNTEKVIIHSPLFQGRREKVMENARIIKEYEDELDGFSRYWELNLDGGDLYYWKKFNVCIFLFNVPNFEDSSQTVFRIRHALLLCLDQDYKIQEDLEIFGRNLTIETQPREYEGLCGHPGLKCKDCLIDNKLFFCKKDKDCYTVGDRDWTNRNMRSFCSHETFNEERLCKREQYTCPPDSLNSDGSVPMSGKCQVDEDCLNMNKFTTLAAKNVSYYPHCFNGFCCARQLLCKAGNDFQYALPVETNALGHSEACTRNEDCNMYPGAIGTCAHFKEVADILKQREIQYLGSSETAKDNSYGMCCYESVRQCSAGGVPFIPELADRPCSNHTDCNPETRPFEWNGYCSINNGGNTCCREKTPDAMCPDGFTPYRNEPICEGVNPVIVNSGTCPNSDGMCHKGHCCPRLTRDHHGLPEAHHSKYLTNAPCDPTQPLDIAYIWAYCDEKEEKVVVMGNRNWNGEELEWQKKRCNLNSDCGHLKYLCVHKLYRLRYCVVNPSYQLENNQMDLWNLTIAIISIFIGIIIVIIWTPTSVFK